jgi:uncharacterized protein (DUF2336 family)
MFDDVMSRLAREIDTSARTSFGLRLAAIPDAPPEVMRALALDDEIAVAGPILSGAGHLDDAVLVEGARTKSQEHLLAISLRPSLVESVTDVLVERGNPQVALSTAANPGARFSDFGFSTLVKRSETDSDLAVRVWSRPEIPRQHMLKLFAEASDTVRSRLEDADRGKASLFRDMIAKASDELQAEARQQSAEYAAAESHVRSLHRSGELDESRLAAFAQAGKFDETTIALSILCDLPIGLIERATAQTHSEQVLVLAKAIGLSWDTVKAILLLQTGTKASSTNELNTLFGRFTKLKAETASKALQFYRFRERAVSSNPN